MPYPEVIKTNDTIGVTACSDGKPSELDKKRLDHAAENLQHAGVKVIETSNCRTSENGRSSSAQDRRKQLEDLLKNDQVKAIIMVSGGDFLCEVLPLLDFSMFLNHPKWVQGYSDPTGLLYTITTNCDLATIYGCNYGDFGMEVWH